MHTLTESLLTIKIKSLTRKREHFQEQYPAEVGDVDELDKHPHLVFHDIPYDEKATRDKLPEDRSENSIAEILDNRFEPIHGSEQSAAQQYRKAALSYQHIKRNRQEYSTNVRRLSTVSYQVIFGSLWHEFHNESQTDGLRRFVLLLLLLSMLTSNKIEDLLFDLSLSHSKRKIMVDLDGESDKIGCLITIKLTSSQRLIKDHMLAQQTRFCLPMPPTFTEILRQKHDIAYLEQIIIMAKAVLERIGKEHHISNTSLGRIQSCMHYVISRYLKGKTTADVLCGVDPRHSSGLYYTAFEYHKLRDSYLEFVDYIGKRIKADQIDYQALTAFKNALSIDTKNFSIGTQRAPDYTLVTLMMEQCSKLAESAHKRDQWVDHQSPYDAFNRYSLWLWHVFMLLTSMRPVNHMPGSLKEINLNLRIMWLSDKERYAKTSGRIVPICNFLHDAIVAYQSYLNHLISTQQQDSSTQHIMTDILAGERPLIHFFISTDEHFRLVPVTPQLIIRQLKKSFPVHLNWTRHVSRSFLQEKVPSYLIDAVFGHELPDQEAWHPYSAFMPSQLKHISETYDTFATRIGLRQLHIAGVTPT